MSFAEREKIFSKDYLKIGEFAKATGLSTQTLRRWDKNGKLKADIVTEHNERYYKREKLLKYLSNEDNITVLTLKDAVKILFGER